MGGSILDGLLGVVELQETELHPGGEAVAAANAVENLQTGIRLALVELAGVPEDRGPIVLRRGDDVAERGRGDFEVRELGHGGFDHGLEGVGLDVAEGLGALDGEPEGGGEVFLVADHDVDILGDLTVDLLGFFQAADGFPERGAVVEIVGHDGAVFVGGFDGFNGDFGGGGGKRGVDAAGVKPAHAEFAEDVVPIDVADLDLGGGGVAPVGIADRAADTEAALGEVETVADGAANAVVVAPLDEVGGDAALHDKIFDEVADLVVDEGGDDGGFVTEAFAETAGGVVFAAAFPDLEIARGANPALARVEAEHDFAERDLIEGAGVGGFDWEAHVGGKVNGKVNAWVPTEHTEITAESRAKNAVGGRSMADC